MHHIRPVNAVHTSAPAHLLNRREFLYGSVAGVSAMALSESMFAESQKENRKMPDLKKTVLMICDCQVGIADLPYAKEAVQRAAAALAAARKAGMLVLFSRVTFEPGYLDVSPRNKAFALVKAKNMLPPGASHLVPAFEPHPNEIVVPKDRFSAFCGNNLETILRSQGITDLVIAGVTTSGVVLSTFSEAADRDYNLTILADACADPIMSLHEELMTNLFPRSASVSPVAGWVAGLTS